MRHNTRDRKGRFVKAQQALMEQKLYPYPLDTYHEDLQAAYACFTSLDETPTCELQEEDDNESLLRDFLQAAAATFILFPLGVILMLAICWIITNC